MEVVRRLVGQRRVLEVPDLVVGHERPTAGLNVSTSFVEADGEDDRRVVLRERVPTPASSARPTAARDAATSTILQVPFTTISLRSSPELSIMCILRRRRAERDRRLEQVPVEEALEPPVEVDLRPGAQESVRLGRVGHVLERLAEAPQLRRRAPRTASGGRARRARRARSAAARRAGRADGPASRADRRRGCADGWPSMFSPQ